MTDLETWLRAHDRETLALTLYGEARGEPVEGRIAVACVIKNRAALKYRGTTVAAVCLYPFQFSCWGEMGGADNYAHVMALAGVVRLGGTLPISGIEREVYDESRWIADGLLAGLVRDRVHGALHYLTRTLFDRSPPRWAANGRICAEVGAHVFLRGIP